MPISNVLTGPAEPFAPSHNYKGLGLSYISPTAGLMPAQAIVLRIRREPFVMTPDDPMSVRWLSNGAEEALTKVMTVCASQLADLPIDECLHAQSTTRWWPASAVAED